METSLQADLFLQEPKPHTFAKKEAIISDSLFNNKKTMPARSTKIVKGKAKIPLGKGKVASLSPASLIKYIPTSKLKSAAKRVIRAQTVGGRGSTSRRKGKKRKGKKKKSKTKRKRRASLFM